MSAEEAVTDALQAPIDQNAQAAEEAKKMLAELQGDDAAPAQEPQEPNGTTEAKAEEDAPQNSTETAPENKNESDSRRDGRNHGRSDLGGRGRGRHGQNGHGSRSYRDNIKSDVTTQEVSSDPVAIRKQVEFYFSDSNLPNDKFLLSKVGGSQNNPVELEILHTFKRMRHFQPFEAIVEAMRESKFLELTNDDTCVQRREPLPESLNDGPDRSAVRVFEDRAMPRSIYAKGFGEEVPSTQFDIEAFFSEYGPTNAVRLRRTDEKIFKGSAFVEFETEELAKAFLEMDPKPKYKGKDLQIMSKKEYCDKKVEDIKSGKIKPNNRYDRSKRDDRGGRDGKRKREGEDTRDWRTRRDEDRQRGFRDGRDDKRRNDRGRDFKGGRGGRFRGTEKDDRGIPTVKSSASKVDTGRDDALAQAKAAVEAENQKDQEQKGVDEVESTEQSANVDASTARKEAEGTTGLKRAREEDEAEVERESKKPDLKSEAVEANGAS